YTLAVINDGNGTTVPAGTSFQTKGVAVSINATSATGYHFVNWTVSSGAANFVDANSASTTVTASTDATIRANFAINTYTVTFNLDGKGTRTGGGELSQTVNHGSAATEPTVSAKPGWTFNGWDVEFNNITSNLPVKAQWEKGPPVIGDPGTQKAMVGVSFILLLSVESESSVLNSVTVKGLPTGLKYDATTKSITGVPTTVMNKTVIVTAKNDFMTPAVRTFTISVEPLLAWAQGTFNGSCVVNNDSGTANMTVTKTGKVTGKLSASGKNYAFTAASLAQRDVNGAFWISSEISVNNEVLPLNFKVRNPAKAEAPNLSVAEGWLANEAVGDPVVKMYRNVWKDTGMDAILEPYIGYYTAVLPGGAAYGSAYLTFTVDKTGKVKTVGKLADSTVVSLSSTLIYDDTGIEAGNSRMVAVIYTSPGAYKGGCMFGLAEFVRPDGNGDVFLRLLDGDPFIWENLNPHATSVAGAGFNRNLGIVGGWYDKTENIFNYYQGKTLAAEADANASEPELNLGVNRYAPAWWDFSGQALAPVLNKAGVMTGLSGQKAGLPLDPDKDYEWDYSAENTAGLKIGLTRATGIFKGSFKAWFDYGKTHTFKNVLYEGVLTPVREDQNDGIEGRGYFLWSDKSQYQNPLGRTVTYPFNWSYDFLVQSGK
ncbi:MAG: InlB B-repeat-containing protein, partial [Victivallales bacterium]